jgi:hypothetical protein
VRGLALRAADGRPPEDILASSGFLFPDFDAGLAFFSPQGDLLASGGEISLWADQTGPFADALAEALSQAGAEPRFSAPLPVSGGEETAVLTATKISSCSVARSHLHDLPLDLGDLSLNQRSMKCKSVLRRSSHAYSSSQFSSGIMAILHILERILQQTPL